MRATVVVLFGLIAAGCTSSNEGPLKPSISSIVVTEATQGIEPVVTADVVVPEPVGLRVERVAMRFRSTATPDRPFVDVTDELARVPGGAGFRGTLPALNFGMYEVEVTATLAPFDPSGAPPTGPNEFVSKTEPFRVGADMAECFNVPEGFGEWTFDGFYAEGATAPVAGVCPADPLVTVSGEAAVLFGACLPSSPADETWRFDVVAPAVTGRPGWSSPTGVALRLNANTSVQLAPVLVTGGMPAGSIAAEAISFGDANAEFRDVTFATPVPEGTAIDGVRLRFEVNPAASATEGATRIVTVCPLPNRPG